MTEEELIKNCQKGVKSSQYLLVKRYSGMLLSVCRRYARDEAMAKDVVQETLIRIFQHIGNYKPTGSFEGWMRQIAVRRSLKWLRKSYFQREFTPEVLPDYQMVVPNAIAKLEAEEIMQLLQELPLGYRTVFNLNIIEGYSHKEIGEMLGITENTSRSQLTRARRLLQQKIQELKKSENHEVASIRK